MKKIYTLIFSLVACYSFAALPPLYQTSSELKAILDSKEFQKLATSSAVIEEIQRVADQDSLFGYQVRTNKNIILVKVEYLPQDYVGPAKYQLHFHLVDDHG